MRIRVTKTANTPATRLAARCPHCGKEAVLEHIGQDISVTPDVVCGQRRCPDPECHGHIFVVARNGRIMAAYPPIRINFEADNIPDQVRKSFEEALDCHAAGCLVASAIMLRRTLEDICSDRKAKGNTLKDRLQDLGSRIVIPKELIDAMDDLRLLGNDAAHIEAHTFDQISNQEVEIAIEFSKEILKAICQYSALLSKIRSLKKPAP